MEYEVDDVKQTDINPSVNNNNSIQNNIPDKTPFLKHDLHHEIVEINSKNRDSGNSTSGNFSLDIHLKAREGELDRVVVLQASIPKSFYKITAGCSFTITELGITNTLTFTPGNYSRRAFINAFQTLVNNNSIAISHTWTYLITLPTADEIQTGKWTITVAGNSGSQPSMVVTNLTLLSMFGFNSGTQTFTANTLISTNVINLANNPLIYIKSDVTSSSNLIILDTSTTMDFGMITHELQFLTHNSSPFQFDRTKFNFVLINSITNEVLDLNGLDWSMLLIFFKKVS